MVKVFENTEKEYYMDGYLKIQLDRMKELSKNDWDFIIVLDGYERTGKSTLAQQIAKYLDNDFQLNQIVFNGIEFEKQAKTLEHHKVLVFDEGYGDLTSKKWMNKVNHSIVKMLTEIGYKNLYLIIVLPSYYDLVKYIAMHRSRVLIHVYDNNFERGYFAWYDKDKKKNLYIEGKKFYSYSQKIASPNFIGRFTKHYAVDKEEYEKKKYLNATSMEKAGNDALPGGILNRQELMLRLKFLGYNQAKIAEILDLTPARVSQLIKIDGVEV